MTKETKFKRAVHKIRQEASSIPEFFDGYSDLMEEHYGVTINFTSYPSDIVDQKSSHDSPMGKEQAWSNEQINNPNIPNTYKAYKGQICGSTNFNDQPSKKFEATRLFWCFGDITIDFFNGNPNQSRYKIENNIETFQFDVILFVEDFPCIYNKYRKIDNIDKLNKSFDNALSDFVSGYKETLDEVYRSSEGLENLRNKSKELNNIQRQIQVLEQNTKKYLENELNKKGVYLPEINNEFINKSRYERILKSHIINDTPSPSDMKSLNNINQALSEFNNYRDKYIEDFL